MRRYRPALDFTRPRCPAAAQLDVVLCFDGGAGPEGAAAGRKKGKRKGKSRKSGADAGGEDEEEEEVSPTE